MEIAQPAWAPFFSVCLSSWGKAVPYIQLEVLLGQLMFAVSQKDARHHKWEEPVSIFSITSL